MLQPCLNLIWFTPNLQLPLDSFKLFPISMEDKGVGGEEEHVAPPCNV